MNSKRPFRVSVLKVDVKNVVSVELITLKRSCVFFYSVKWIKKNFQAVSRVWRFYESVL